MFAQVLHLTLNGVPVEWAGNWVHCDVERRSGQGDPSPEVPHVAPPARGVVAWTERAAVHMEVSPDASRVVLFGDDGEPVEAVTLPGADGIGSQQWDAMREIARRLVDEHLLRMQASYEVQNGALPNFNFRNPSRQRQRRWDVPVLGKWLLFNHRPPDKRDRDRLRTSAILIGIDLPGALRDR